MEDPQTSHQMLSNNVSYWAHLEMMVNELTVEQENDSFSTQPVLDPKPNRPMLIQEHINQDRMKRMKKV